MLAFAELIAKRATLHWLVHHHPEWTQPDLADALKRSRSWVSQWLRRQRQADPADVRALHSRTPARHSPPSSIASQPAVVQRILQMRVEPPENWQRVPGPETLLSFLHRDPVLTTARVRLPRSQTTIWKILRQAGCIAHDHRRKPKLLELRQPGEEVQFDLKDESLVPAEPEGKRAHVVEVANARRCRHLDLVAPRSAERFRCRGALRGRGPVFLPAWLARHAHHRPRSPPGGKSLLSAIFPRHWSASCGVWESCLMSCRRTGPT
jgi:hypothetical protein